MTALAAYLWALGSWTAVPISLVQATAFSQRIPAADLEKYKSVRDAKDWANPYLIVKANGIEVIAKTIPSGREVVAVGDLREALMTLPSTAWPYGRVVAIQPSGLGGSGDRTPIARNMQIAQDVLKALPVVVDPWPP
jgi:hypothetical protein